MIGVKLPAVCAALLLALIVVGCGGENKATPQQAELVNSPDEEAVRAAVAGFLNTSKGFFDADAACRYVTTSAIAEFREAVAPDSVDAGSAMNCSVLLTSATLSLGVEEFREMANTPIESIVGGADEAEVALQGVEKKSPWVKTPTGWKLDSLIKTLPIPETEGDDAAE